MATACPESPFGPPKIEGSAVVPRLLPLSRMTKAIARLLLLIALVALPASAAGAAPSSPGDACRRLPEGKRLKLSLKPNTDVVDLVAWISAITCKQFVIPGAIPSQRRTVTIIAPRPITPAEAYDLFLGALDSVNLTVYADGAILRLIETSKIKSAPIPVYLGRETSE
jgi:type II secretory pathway component GspD/PulD (secretin)